MSARQHSTSRRVGLHETCLVVSSCVYKFYKHKSQPPLQCIRLGGSFSQAKIQRDVLHIGQD